MRMCLFFLPCFTTLGEEEEVDDDEDEEEEKEGADEEIMQGRRRNHRSGVETRSMVSYPGAATSAATVQQFFLRARLFSRAVAVSVSEYCSSAIINCQQRHSAQSVA